MLYNGYSEHRAAHSFPADYTHELGTSLKLPLELNWDLHLGSVELPKPTLAAPGIVRPFNESRPVEKLGRFRKGSGLNEDLGRHEDATGPKRVSLSGNLPEDITHRPATFRFICIY